jgi:hypothetical protein
VFPRYGGNYYETLVCYTEVLIIYEGAFIDKNEARAGGGSTKKQSPLSDFLEWFWREVTVDLNLHSADVSISVTHNSFLARDRVRGGQVELVQIQYLSM